MARNILKLTALALLATAGVANAGGFARGTADTDILFEEGNFNLRAGATYVSPTRKYTVNGSAGLIGTSYTNSYAIPSAAVKLNVTDDLRCAGTLTQPYGGSASWDVPTVTGKLSEVFTITETALTCGYKFDLAKGRAWILGGVFMESFDYERVNYRTATTRFNLGLSGSEMGWRIGAAYEIPEIALRAQLMYRSGSSYGASGDFNVVTLSGTTVGSFGALGEGEMPQSVELKLQSGVAPGWLVFGSAKWTDWSVTEQLLVNVPALAVVQTNDYFWKDGWTVTAGVGHAFNDQWSGAASITWDQGVKTGWDLSSDTWTFGVGGSYKDSMGGELKFGGGLTYISAASTSFGAPEAVDSGMAWALGASYKTKW